MIGADGDFVEEDFRLPSRPTDFPSILGWGTRKNQQRHANKHRRNLPSRTRRHSLGAGQHQCSTRLLEPQSRRCTMVLRFFAPQRCRGDTQYRRCPSRIVAERRLECAAGPMVGRQRVVRLVVALSESDVESLTDSPRSTLSRSVATKVLARPSTLSS